MTFVKPLESNLTFKLNVKPCVVVVVALLYYDTIVLLMDEGASYCQFATDCYFFILK